MIDLTCSTCGRTYKVPDTAAGKQAKCRCGALLEVLPLLTRPTTPPAVQSPNSTPPSSINASADACGLTSSKPPTTSPPAPKLPMRTRRLIADAQQVEQLFRDFPMISPHGVAGDPPEVYHVDYAVRSLEAKSGKAVPRETHRVEIRLTADYPRLSPQCKMLTPIFHPNIDESTICVGDHWTAGEHLADLIVRIGQMIAYQAYNIKSPLNAEAAMWADLHADQLPTDHRNLYPPGAD